METVVVTGERTCVGCRKAAGRRTLVRLVRAPDGRAVVDHPPRLGGRGAWVHADRVCLERAFDRGGLARALESAECGTPGEVATDLARRLEDRIAGMIAGGRGGSRIAVGTEAVRQTIASGPAYRVLLAVDARGDRDAIEAAARRAGIPTSVVLDKARIGRAVGKETVGVLAVTDQGLAAAIGREIELFESLQAQPANAIEATR